MKLIYTFLETIDITWIFIDVKPMFFDSWRRGGASFAPDDHSDRQTNSNLSTNTIAHSSVYEVSNTDIRCQDLDRIIS